MVRFSFAVTRLIVAPYGVLLVLHFLIVGGGGAWLYYQVRSIPSLRNVSVRGPDAGFKMIGGRGVVASRDTLPLPADTRGDVADLPPAQRLHSKSDREFLISYDFFDEDYAGGPLRLDCLSQ